ncbi:hypothetical protein BGX24_005444 [Mortierella sp. AD032]|nr:hypothetical protein BGX24_005444 [Mortierella sp. AD032]
MMIIVLWGDVLLAFEDAVHVRHNSRVLPFLRGPNFQVLRDTRPEVTAAAPTASTRTTPALSAVPSTAPTVVPVVTTTPGLTATQLQNSLRTALSLLDDDQDDEDDDAPPPNYQQAIANDPIYHTTTTTTTTAGNGTAAAPPRIFGHGLPSSMASVASQPLPIHSTLAPPIPRTTTIRESTTAISNCNNHTAFHAATGEAAARAANAATTARVPGARAAFDSFRITNTTATYPPLSNSTRASFEDFVDFDSSDEDDNGDSDDEYAYDDIYDFFAAADVVDPTQRPSVVMH